MQLLVACGGQTGTRALQCSLEQDSVLDVKQRLASSYPALGPAETMVGLQAFLSLPRPATSQPKGCCETLPLCHALQVLLCGGRTMHSYMPLSACPSLGPGSILNLTGRLLGGGGDGGSTGAESRSCYLEMYLGKKPDKVNPAEELLARCVPDVFWSSPYRQRVKETSLAACLQSLASC